LIEKPTLSALADRVKRLPTLPTVYAHVTAIMDNPNSSVADVGEIVSRDQAIVAKLLRIVNSAFYGLSQKVTTVPRAMAVVGFRALKDLILTVTVMPMLKQSGGDNGADQRAFWTHAITSAAAARALARVLQLPEPEELFTAGLLHDIGKIAEYWFLKDGYAEVIDRASERHVPVFEAEREVFGFTHAQVGRLLADRWQFPTKLVHAIGSHHSPSSVPAFQQETALIHLADILARAVLPDATTDNRVPPLDAASWEDTGLEVEQLETCMAFLEEEMERGKAFLSIVQQG